MDRLLSRFADIEITAGTDQHFIELEIVERLRTIIVTSLERVVVKNTRV